MISAFFRFIILVFCIVTTSDLFSQDQKSEFRKDIFADENKISLLNNETDFFTGCIHITDKNNNMVFEADSIYSRYNWDTLIDLNNDGSKELILDLGTGATMYDYNMYLIFDFKNKSFEPFEIHNAELVTNVDDIPKIISYVRMSPAVMGAGFTFSLKYDGNKIILENDISKSKVLKSLDPLESDEFDFIRQYEEGFDECENDSEVKIYYEAYLTQQMILGQEEKGWKLFEKHYKCKNKKSMRVELKKTVEENYKYLRNADYKFQTLN